MIRVQSDSFDPGAELNAFQKGKSEKGAFVCFTGSVRDFAKDQSVTALELEHYPGYTEKEIARIAGQTQDKWPDTELAIIHRYGRLEPGEPIVLVMTASAHRKAAFAAAEFLMDYLKTGAPFWKKEIRDNGAVWIEPTEEDYNAQKEWQRV